MQTPQLLQPLAKRRVGSDSGPPPMNSNRPETTSVGGTAATAGRVGVTGQTSTHLPHRVQASAMLDQARSKYAVVVIDGSMSIDVLWLIRSSCRGLVPGN